MKNKKSLEKKDETKIPKKNRFAVMKLYNWNSVSAGGVELSAPIDGISPQHFIPVFETREQAVSWAGGDENVMEVQPKNP